jgi:dihydropteroate synthase
MRFLNSCSDLSGTKLGEHYTVRIMGIINASPDSFYKRSVKVSAEDLRETALAMVQAGADIIDVGGRSTAPHVEEIPLGEEARRLRFAIETIKNAVNVPISADTTRVEPAKAALEAGATIVNDVSGLKHDPKMKDLIAEKQAATIVVACENRVRNFLAMKRITRALEESLALAREAGIPKRNIVVDPGLGFFRKRGRELGFSLSENSAWYAWDCDVIREIGALQKLGRPVCISISRKSFISKILGLEDPKDRLLGSLAATSIAVFNGVNLVRTHDVAATVQAVRIAESIKNASKIK